MTSNIEQFLIKLAELQKTYEIQIVADSCGIISVLDKDGFADFCDGTITPGYIAAEVSNGHDQNTTMLVAEDPTGIRFTISPADFKVNPNLGYKWVEEADSKNPTKIFRCFLLDGEIILTLDKDYRNGDVEILYHTKFKLPENPNNVVSVGIRESEGKYYIQTEFTMKE